MRRSVLFGLCIVLLLSISAASIAVSIGEGPVELDPDETVNITPVNSTETYEVPEATVLGALNASSVLGMFEFQVAEDLPPEEGNLSILSIAGIENELVNETPNNWTYWVNGEQGTTGPAVTNVTDGDNVTFSYGPPTHTLEDAAYTLVLNVSVIGAVVTPTPTVNVTPTPGENVTPTPTVNVTPTPTVNVTPTPTVNVTPTPGENVTPTPTVNVTPTPGENVTPSVNVSDQPIVNATVIVDNATINQTGWADIHADLNGTPGPIIGYSPISEGVNENVTVAIEVEDATPVLYAMLHVDEGEPGVHEFPGPDVPILVNGSPVQQAFNVTGGLPPVNVTPTPTVNVTPTPTVNVTPTPTVNVTPTPTVNVTPTPTVNVTPEVNITEEIVAGLSGQENLTTFVGLVNNSTLGERLEANRSYVICAPTNEAFDGLGNETLSTIMNNTTLLNNILDYHVIQGDYTIEELVMLCENSTNGQISLPTVAGTDVNVSLTDGQLLINNIVVVTQIQITNNIVVYVLDDVLIPPDTPIPTPTPTMTPTPTPTVNVTPTPTVNVTPTPTVNVTPTPTVNVTPTPTVNVTPTPTVNVTPTPTVNVTPTPTVNVTPTPTVNVTPTPTVNVTPTPTVNVTPTPTVNVTPTPTVNVTPTPTVNVTPTPTVNVTPTPTVNVTPTPTVNVTPTPVPPGETVDLQLYEGWNFISIPRQLSVGNDTAAAVFADVDTDGRPIYTYTPAGGFEPLGENETLMVLEGYWVYSTEETTVDLMLSTNPVRSPAVKTLSPGWNAIGYSDLTERSADNALTSVEDIWVYVVGYDAEDQSYQPALINNVTGAQGENQRLSPTEGYWLFVREDGRLAAISA